MPDTSSSTKPTLKPVVKKGRRLSPIWIIPILAAVLGLWLAWKYYAARGPEITVRFETAEGIVGGKTPVLCKNVTIGTVDKVRLTKDLKGVIVTMQMTSEATDLLTKDAQIWVVRPRYGGASGISGLSTIVSGSYIELEPGLSDEERREFVGLENPPVTPKGVPGLHITFFTDEAGSIGPGTPILYKGLAAGKIESRTFYSEERQDRVWRFYFEGIRPARAQEHEVLERERDRRATGRGRAATPCRHPGIAPRRRNHFWPARPARLRARSK